MTSKTTDTDALPADAIPTDAMPNEHAIERRLEAILMVVDEPQSVVALASAVRRL